ncbi:SGNH/GDSL hydrolase family protein [Paenibacillus tyrfis]|uniref:SGNH/GDSL hydrolase family protein n=1 Tax=Paenibacillus tyrfis TaxID=1501230 RepID=UPI000B593D50|nr:SGNH/GDSL hydrolase family protein [Paenibacillus tyrfis]
MSDKELRLFVQKVAGHQQQQQKLQAVATRGSHLGAGVYPTKPDDPVVKEQTSRTYHEFACDCTDVALVYGNYYDFDQPNTNKITDKASIEYPIGSTTRNEVYGPNGSREMVIEPGGLVESSGTGVRGKKGDGFYTYTCVTVPEGGKFPRGQVAYTSRGEGLKNADIVDSGTTDAQGQFVHHPVAIIGKPKEPTPAVLIVGDSIAGGAQDNPQDRGFIPLALGKDIPWIRVAKGNESSYGFSGSACRFRMRLAKYCTHSVIHYGTNDFLNKNLAQFQADLIALLQLLSDYGLKNYVCTIPPRTVSKTDMSPVNPAFALNGDVMKANAWLLSNPRPDLIAGVFDTAKVLRNPEKPAEWDPAVLGSDGIHPGAVGHTRMAAQIDLSKFKM